MTEQMTSEDRIAEMQSHTLRQLAGATKNLRHELLGAKRDAEEAIAALAAGRRVMGMSLGVGPLGHQRPFDIAKATAEVNSLLDQAAMLGCSDDDIAAAYTVA